MTNSARPNIVIPGDDPAQLSGSRHLTRLEERGEVVLFQDRPTSDEEKVRRAANADILINSRGSVKWPAQLLEQLPKLRFLTVCGVGTDSIDLEAARQRGIVVSNVPGKTAPVVAEHALGIMMAVAKRAAYQTAELKAGRWTQIHCVYLTGRTLGVVGTGTIGGHMIRLARAIGMEVVAWTFHPSPEREKELARISHRWSQRGAERAALARLATETTRGEPPAVVLVQYVEEADGAQRETWKWFSLKGIDIPR